MSLTNRKTKSRLEADTRAHLNAMLKGKDGMHKLGGQLRLRQLQGKLKHARHLSKQEQLNPERKA